MSTLKEDLTTIKEIQDGLVDNKVARFSYTQSAYDNNTVNGVNEYNVNYEQNIPNGTASIMKVNSTVLDKGYRAQASSITRMLMNHFLGRISYNLNKVNDNMQSLLDTLITKFPTSLPANGGRADTATTASKVANSLTFGSKTYDGSSAQTITASDLGISTVSFGKFCPDLTKAKEKLIVDSSSTIITFIVPSDGWILNVSTFKNVSLFILIDGEGSMEKTPCLNVVGPYTTPNGTDFIRNCLNCPYPVKKGQKIRSGVASANSYLIFAPCLGN